MLEVARPIFLAAAAGAALIPVVLHFLAHREGVPAPLPTARFLSGELRRRPRFHRRPSHLPLLLLRVLFVLLLGAAFAGVRWVPDGEAIGDVLVVDRGEGMGALGEEGLRLADSIAAGSADARVVVVGQGADGEWEGEVSLIELLEAGRATAAEMDAPRLRLTLFTRLRDGSWTPDLLVHRTDLWPGQLRIVVPSLSGAPPGESAGPSIRVHVTPEARPAAERAAQVLGVSSVERVEWVEWVERIGAGAPWDLDGSWPGAPPRALLLPDGYRAFGPWSPLRGTPSDADETPFLWEGGRPAGSVRRGENGGACEVVLGWEWDVEEGAIPPDPEWIRGLAALLDACTPLADRPSWDPLPSLRARIVGEGLPEEVSIQGLEGEEVGRSLDRLLLAVLLLLAGVEGVMAFRGRAHE